jgi:hypothetical protein
MLERTPAHYEAVCDRCLVPAGDLGTTELEARARLIAFGWTPRVDGNGPGLWVCAECGKHPPLAYARPRRRHRSKAG